MMKKRIGALAAALVVLLTACASKDGPGHTLTAAIGDKYETLDPIYAVSTLDRTVLSHLYETLMRKTSDAEGTVTAELSLARSVEKETNVDGTMTLTIRLRSAKWSDGKAVTADDVVYAWRRLAAPANRSPHAELMSVVSGYQEARESGDMSLLQVTAKNDTTVQVNLTGDYGWFLTEVCTDPAAAPLRRDIVPTAVGGGEAEVAEREMAEPERWWDDLKTLVCSGTYVPESQGTEYLRMVKNENHYDHGKKPGPEGITFRYVDTPQEGLELFESGEVEVVWPAGEGTEQFDLATEVLVLNCATFPYQDEALRKATVQVLERNTLAALVGGTAAEALVPHGVPDDDKAEDFRACAGPLVDNTPETYAQRCAEALELIRSAGYDSGASLGPLRLVYLKSELNDAIVTELVRMFRDMLLLYVEPEGLDEAGLAAAVAEGDFHMALMTVDSPINDAEGFLRQWVSTVANPARYENTAFDALLTIVAAAPDGTARLGCLHDAEELLITDAAITPLYTTSTAWAKDETLFGIWRDARGIFSFGGGYHKTA